MILVYGLAVAGAATVRALRAARRRRRRRRRHGRRRASGRSPTSSASSWSSRPDDDRLAALVAPCELVVPAPGVPETHRLFAAAAAAGRPGAQRDRARLPVGAGAARRAAADARRHRDRRQDDDDAVGRRDARRRRRARGRRRQHRRAARRRARPRRRRLRRRVHELPPGVDRAFRGDAAAWLNLAPDHLNWHASMATYEAAKARIFAQQRPGDVAIGFADDPVVMGHLDRAPGPPPHVRPRPAPTTTSPAATLRRPAGRARAGRRDAPARCPTTSPTGSPPPALVLESGPRRARRGRPPALASFVGPPHRIELVGDDDGVRWFNDSKATTPHAASVAIRAFDHVVLIAGGRNKGLDLAPMAAEPDRAPRRRRRSARPPTSIAATFAGVAPVVTAGVDGRRRRAGRRGWPARATSCCCRRAAPASTGTPTAATRPVATTSAGSSHDHGLDVEEQASMTLDRPMAHDRRVRPARRGPSVADRRRQALERLHGGPARPVRAAGRRRASRRRRPSGRGVWDVQRGPAPVAYYVIGVVVAVFVMLGLVMVLSASAAVEVGEGQQPVPHLQPPGDVGRRSGSSGCSSPCACTSRWVRRLAIPLVVLAAAGMALPFVPGVGATVNDARAWVTVGSFSLQPSEFLKLAARACSPPTCSCAART